MIDCKRMFRKFSKAARRFAHAEAGGALVEMAISSTIVLATFISVFQLSMACYTYNTCAEVARESARWAAVRGASCGTNTPTLDHCGATPTDIQNYAKTVGALNWSQCTTANPCITASWKTATTSTGVTQQKTTWAACASGCGKPGDMVVVKMVYPYAFGSPFFQSFSWTLGSTSEMIVAQ
jgi:Flp pilus assembly protein TadG